MSAWIYQDDKQVKKFGAQQASWYVGWIDPEGRRRCKSCGPGPQGKKSAERYRRKVEAELMTGTYQMNSGQAPPRGHRTPDEAVQFRPPRLPLELQPPHAL
jgi:hypothetical protein